MITLRQKIGQLLIIGFDGAYLDTNHQVRSWLRTENLGGVLLFDIDLATQRQGKNLVNKKQIAELIHQLNSCHSADNLPPFIAIDYEGGAVNRLKKIDGCMPTLTAAALSELPKNELSHYSEQMANTLSELGFNLNFAPVVDLNLSLDEGIIGKLGRSFSADPEQVSFIARQFVDAFAKQGIASCYKHFPGHGSALADSHYGFVDVTETFCDKELIPYYSLSSDHSMVMTAHVINRQLDASGLPATLSYKMLTELLRNKIGFDGVIISDDLQMNAISHHFSTKEALRLTFNAGADMVIFGNQLDSISAPEVIDIVEQLVQEQKISQARIEEAYQRVIRLKEHTLFL